MKSFFTVPKALLFSFVLCFIFYLLINLWFVNIPELYPGASIIGDLFSRICLAFITGYFFYVIVNQLKKDKDEENIKPFLKERIANIVTHYNTILTDLSKTSKYTYSFPPTIDDVNKMFQIIETNKFNPPVDTFIQESEKTWLEYFIQKQNLIKKEINFLLINSAHLKSELIKLSANIVDSDFFAALDNLSILANKIKQINILSEQFYSFSNNMFDAIMFAYENGLIDEDEKVLILVKKAIDKRIVDKLGKSS